ncbi:U-box domain-containing protein 26-like [Vigna unguiculata]|uniref:U-box domain-containing protein n=1 Tax=Vigna unguiculata TaxID=3917 RepID=A0A4D6NQ25_VIGUN|nr:U-box domain-containing protein 26-like [Vigna unguiculata]QCE15082.1 STIP1 homology and U-box containing protein 1 [Vigna unguiculata]
MNEAQIEITIPHLFRCPISLDLFEDPVTLSTGQTYDRSSIEKWFSAGNLTCPVTMQKLRDPSIVPNHTLRHLIDQWLQLGPQFGNSATIDYLAALKHTLESPQLENKLQALEKITVLSDEYCSFRKSCFHQLSFLPLLLELVFGTEFANCHMKFTELALSCIIKLLPFVSLEPLNMIKDESKSRTFLLLFEKGTSSVKTSLCHLIDSTASPQTEEVCQMLGHSQKLVREIVVLVRQGCEVSKVAIKAMLALCYLQSNRDNLVRAGAIDGVIIYISGCDSRQKNLAPFAMAIIKNLLVLESAKEALVNHPCGVATLVKMVFRVCNQECSESAVGILAIVCRDFGRARDEAIGAGVLTQLLFLLQSQCGPKTKTKARMLLKLLRSKWIEEPKQV